MKKILPILSAFLLTLSLITWSGQEAFPADEGPDPSLSVPAPALEDPTSETVTIPSSPVTGEQSEPSGPGENAVLDSQPSATVDKAAPKPRSTKVPEFTLPEVVITGENQLTIGAKRIEHKIDDVTIGTKNLRGLDRPVNDLPGLDKSLTALSSGPGEEPKGSALILHAGGGRPSCWGGWVLFGQEFRQGRYLFSGDLSDGRGESAGIGRIHEKRRGYGLDVSLQPASTLHLQFTRTYSRRTEQLPYTLSQADRRGVELVGKGEWRFTENLKILFEATVDELPMDHGWGTPMRIREPKGLIQLSADPRHPTVEGVDVSGAVQKSMGDFTEGDTGIYRLGWADMNLRLRAGDQIRGSTGVRYARYSRFDLPGRPDPRGEVSALLDNSTRLALSARRERVPHPFYRLFLGTPYVFPANGFEKPLDIEREYRAELSRKVRERWVLTGSFTWGRWGDRMQWTEAAGPSAWGVPDHLRTTQVLGTVDFRIVNARLECEPGPNWSLAADYKWRAEEDVTGANNVTDVPRHEGGLTASRKTDKLEATLGFSAASPWNAYGNRPGRIGSHITWNMSVRRELCRNIVLWAEGRNLLGKRYEVQPGYPALRTHLTAGVEVVF